MPSNDPASDTPCVGSVRRYYLGKRIQLRQEGDEALSDVFAAKQEGIVGTPLPSSVPHQTELRKLGYITIEDLTGADVEELVDSGLSRSLAANVIAALE